MRECPDCFSSVKLHSDYPSSFLESFFKSIGIVKVKRCPNCNAAVFLVLGVYTTSRKRLKVVRERVFWLMFIGMLLIVGYVVFEAMMN